MGRLFAVANVPHSYDDSGLDASLIEVLRTDIPFRLLVLPNTLSILTHSSTECTSSAKSTLRRVSYLHGFLRQWVVRLDPADSDGRASGHYSFPMHWGGTPFGTRRYYSTWRGIVRVHKQAPRKRPSNPVRAGKGKFGPAPSCVNSAMPIHCRDPSIQNPHRPPPVAGPFTGPDDSR